MQEKGIALTTFGELAVYQWFKHYGKLYQKLPNLNGANCYKMYVGFRYLKPGERVTPVAIPEMVGYPSKTEDRTRAVVHLLENGTWKYSA